MLSGETGYGLQDTRDFGAAGDVAQCMQTAECALWVMCGCVLINLFFDSVHLVVAFTDRVGLFYALLFVGF